MQKVGRGTTHPYNQYTQVQAYKICASSWSREELKIEQKVNFGKKTVA